MSLGGVLLGIWLILIGLSWISAIAIGTAFLGWWALITGIIMLVEIWHPLTVFRRS
jgi:hypothetical protein